MKLVGFVGASGAGKTTFMEGVIAGLRAQGQWVSVLKHAHHARFEPDVVGKDSWRHRKAGALETMVVNAERLALFREFPQARADLSIDELVGEFTEVPGGRHWLLVEGFRGAAMPKIELWDPDLDRPALYLSDPFVVAIVTDQPQSLPAPTALPLLGRGEPARCVRMLLGDASRFDWQADRV